MIRSIAGETQTMLSEIETVLNGIQPGEYLFNFIYFYSGSLLMAEQECVIHDVIHLINEKVGIENIVGNSFTFLRDVGNNFTFTIFNPGDAIKDEAPKHIAGSVANA